MSQYIPISVPQATHTGPVAFLFMINDLLSNRHSAKFVDDTTVWELCEDCGATSETAAIAAETEAWLAVNNMMLNGDKTMQGDGDSLSMHWCRHCPCAIDNTVVEQVTSFKLLRCRSLTTSSRGKIMLTASTPRPAWGCTFCAYSEGLGLSHTTASESSPPAVCSILEHACATWHTCLTEEQLEKLESIRSAVGYVHCCPADPSYRQALATFGLPMLKERRDKLGRDLIFH